MTDLNNILNSGKGRLTEEKLVAYFNGELSAEEQHEVELWLSEEGMETDAVEGLKELAPGDRKSSVSKLNNFLNKKLKDKRRQRRKAFKDNWSIIAVFLILIICIACYLIFHLLSK
jgi:hypothetical protein